VAKSITQFTIAAGEFLDLDLSRRRPIELRGVSTPRRVICALNWMNAFRSCATINQPTGNVRTAARNAMRG
jgi:hypothetical protein